MTLSTGTSLGPYEIVALIGAGGMGEVYRARDTRLGRDVALKVLIQALPSESDWQRFQREARAASALTHPNICAVFDVGEFDGRPYLVMELLEGRTLRHYIGDQPVEPATVQAFGAQIAEALEAAHAKGLVHRDVKPGNIMISGRHVKVLDFGLAKHVPAQGSQDTRTMDSLTISGTIVGTPQYLAPEVLQGSDADVRSDVWALGVVLHEMLAGRVPFRGTTLAEIGAAILHEAAPPVPYHVPPGLRSVVERCLAKRPEERFQRAGEVQAALETLPGAVKAPSPLGRRRWIWGLSGAAGLAAVGVIWQLTGKEPPPNANPAALTTGEAPSPTTAANQAFERFLVALRVDQDAARAQQMLDRALELDPGFTAAHRWNAFLRVFRVDQGISNDSSAILQAEQELQQLQAEHPEYANVHPTFAFAYLHQGNKERAREHLRLAETGGVKNDQQIPIIQIRADYLDGQADAAYRRAQQVLQAFPLFTFAAMMMGVIDTERGNLPAGIAALEQIDDATPSIASKYYLTLALLYGGQTGRARETIDRARAGDKVNYLLRLAEAAVLAKEGRREEALAEMDRDLQTFAQANVFATLVAADVCALAREAKLSLDWLQQAVRNGDERAAWFRRNPLLASVRDEPRFQQIVALVEGRRRGQ